MSSRSLLDVNLLVALLWPIHADHAKAQKWFVAHKKHGWATCPFTQTGFVRISSNPRIFRSAVTPHRAIDVLAENLKAAEHEFWPAKITIQAAIDVADSRPMGHQQMTDAYLLGLAIKQGGALATLDSGIRNLLPPGSPHAGLIVVVGE